MKIVTTIYKTWLFGANDAICCKNWDSLYSPYQLLGKMYIMYHFVQGFACCYDKVGQCISS